MQKGGNIIDTILPSRENLPPNARNVLDIAKEKFIVNLRICRKPIQSYIINFLKTLTLGQVNEDMKRLNYYDLFHLFMLIRLSNNLVIKVEKNEIINFQMVNENEVNYQDYIDIPIDFPNIQIRFGNFIQNTINMVGPDIYFYNHQNSNCQYFVLDLLKANGLLNDRFVYFYFIFHNSLFTTSVSFILLF